MKKNVLMSVIALVLAVAIGAAAFSPVFAQVELSRKPWTPQPRTPQAENQTPPQQPGTPVSTDALTAEETASLLFMVEEEKLARDVYTYLSTTWGVSTFSNIAASEQAHINAITRILTRYGVPVPSMTPGVFQNSDLQALYNSLIAAGKTSLVAALKVGAAIEEIDILDLQERMAETDNALILSVYQNLMNGSYNHLKGFVRELGLQGMTYAPQYMTVNQYNAAIGDGSIGKTGNPQGARGRR